MKPIVVFGFRQTKDAEHITKTGHILTCMNGNINFPDASSQIAAVSTALDEYQIALTASKNGGKLNTEIKKKKRKALEKALKVLGLYVQINCKDDIAILLSSGFKGRKDRSPSENPGAPEHFKVEAGQNRGTMKLSVKSHKKAVIYVFQWALVTESSQIIWETILGKRKVTINNLIPGKEYQFRSAIKGNGNDLIYSDVIIRFAS